MNTEEIDYWLRLFSNNNQSFMYKDGKKITIFKVFQELKELQYLLKIKNDYIKELESYKYNMDCDYLRLEKENEELKKQFEEYKHKGLYNTCLPYSTGYNKAIKEKENQQKEFIEWLENEKNIYPYDISDYTYEDIINTILSKYYEIIDK